MIRQVIFPAVRTLTRRPITVAPVQRMMASYSGSGKSEPMATMDDLPVPSGSWEAQYKAKQAKYNLHLALGVVVFSVTFLVAKSTGALYLNYLRPDLPADR
ncbi:uncharacterized protein LOC106667825 [Cimex lectularius]|uniref:Deltamethrin resistance protein prag01 domain-containing protein n=1 Tax=Cimex lectularius TaxID=79782 RepID=A0A8I6RVB2_CIMLE|nr:uncharacterized protein LOC106667825 [Cimex lectularius]